MLDWTLSPLLGPQPSDPIPTWPSIPAPTCEWLLQSESSKATEQSVSFRSARLVSLTGQAYSHRQHLLNSCGEHRSDSGNFMFHPAWAGTG